MIGEPPKSHIPDFAKVIKAFNRATKKVFFPAVRQFAAEQKDAFVEKIKGQKFHSFALHPLSPRWLACKRAAGADKRVLIATQHYVNSIAVHEEKATETKLSLRIGFAHNAKAVDLHNRPQKITLERTALINEYGSSAASIPPRPAWRPHLWEMHTKAKQTRKEIAGKIVAAVKKDAFGD